MIILRSRIFNTGETFFIHVQEILIEPPLFLLAVLAYRQFFDNKRVTEPFWHFCLSCIILSKCDKTTFYLTVSIICSTKVSWSFLSKGIFSYGNSPVSEIASKIEFESVYLT